MGRERLSKNDKKKKRGQGRSSASLGMSLCPHSASRLASSCHDKKAVEERVAHTQRNTENRLESGRCTRLTSKCSKRRRNDNKNSVKYSCVLALLFNEKSLWFPPAFFHLPTLPLLSLPNMPSCSTCVFHSEIACYCASISCSPFPSRKCNASISVSCKRALFLRLCLPLFTLSTPTLSLCLSHSTHTWSHTGSLSLTLSPSHFLFRSRASLSCCHTGTG